MKKIFWLNLDLICLNDTDGSVDSDGYDEDAYDLISHIQIYIIIYDRKGMRGSHVIRLSHKTAAMKWQDTRNKSPKKQPFMW